MILQNLKTTALDSYATVLKKDAFIYLREDHEKPFDFIYIAPPQYEALWLKAMTLLDEKPELLDPEGQVIVQIHPKEYIEDHTFVNFKVIEQRTYGDTMLVFYKKLLEQ